MIAAERREFLALSEGQSHTYFMVSIPKKETDSLQNKLSGFSKLIPVGQSIERLYFVYCPIMKGKLSPDVNYYKQIITRKNDKLIFEAISGTKVEFEAIN